MGVCSNRTWRGSDMSLGRPWKDGFQICQFIDYYMEQGNMHYVLPDSQSFTKYSVIGMWPNVVHIWCMDQMEISFLSGSAWLIAMILHMQRYVIVLGVLMNMFTLKEKLLISCVLWISYVCDSSKVQMYCLTCSSGCKITVVCYGTYQIMSGDDWGDVATCVKTGELIQKCCAHMGFDMHCSAVWCNADHFIGYTDGNMNVTDIFCGGILATL